jgi:hypothetical protein
MRSRPRDDAFRREAQLFAALAHEAVIDRSFLKSLTDLSLASSVCGNHILLNSADAQQRTTLRSRK